ncbi:hypothetical protein GCM10011494_12640 [Novosphingobium endophyticum]|uniref:Uncharacterized protein n=1 Tax=Novosphingobium endophyticum TaxID=1955250 RepID=A0A916TRL2_9SPHN|nr:hypothetical protein GCM10011494_12640 [Novosphingobium endophyticum]
MDGALAPGWRFAAHLGVSGPDAPLHAATAGSIESPVKNAEARRKALAFEELK